MGVLRTRCGAMPGWATGGRASGKAHGALGGKLSRSLRSLRPIAAASAVAGPRRFPEGAWTHHRGGPATAQEPAPQGVRPHPRPGTPRGWAAAMGALREARSQLAAERTPDSPDGTAPPVADLRDNGAPPLGGKLSRSLRSLRPIAAASVVAGPRRFPEGAWIHRRGGPATAQGPGTPTGVGPHSGPGVARGLGHTQARAPRRGLGHTQARAPRDE